MKKDLLIIGAILIIGSVLRLWQLGQIPISLDWDEASLAYNAYSIAETGKDEYGQFLPVVLRSFDDYKPALYSYLAIPFIKIFDLSMFSIRIVSVISGIIAVFITFVLVKELFDKKYLAFLASFLLAISPWHIQFSRAAFEANVGLTLILLALILFLKGLRDHKLLVLSAIFAALSLYAYQAEKAFVPLLTLLLIFVYRRQILAIPKKYLAATFVVGAIVALPILTFTLTNKESLTRATGTSIFANRTSIPDFIPDFDLAVRNLININNNDFVGLIFDNRRVVYLRQLISNYFWHYDLNWLFIEGEGVNKNVTNLRHQAYQMGNLYLWELPFILLGIYVLIFSKIKKETKFLILGWLLIVPIPSSIAWDVPNSVRTLNFLPTFQIFTALGLLFAFQKISNIKYFRSYRESSAKPGQISSIQIKYLVFSMFFLFLIFNLSYYLNQYFVQYDYFVSAHWQYGYVKLIPEIQKIEGDYDKIVISTKIPLDQSYIFFLFHLKYPPKEYQKASSKYSGVYKSFHKVGKYEFRDFSTQVLDGNYQNTLFVGGPKDFLNTKKIRILKTIYFLDGTEAFLLVDKRTQF